MDIAFIHPRYPSAEGTGATHSATQIVNGLADAGHDVAVYCPRDPAQENASDKFELYHLAGNSSHPHTNTRLNKEIKARTDEFQNYDIVHSYLMELIPSIATIGREHDVGTVVTLNAYGGICAKNDLLYRNEEICESKSNLKCLNCISKCGFSHEQGSLYSTLSRLFSLRLVNIGERRLEHIDAFRAPSKHVRDNYAQFAFDRRKINIIPHPVDKKFCIPHQSDFSEPYDLLYVGSLSKHKGVNKLVPILDALEDSKYEFQLSVVGTGELESKIREQITERGLDSKVTLRGFVPNSKLPDVYAKNDIFIYPGIWEEPLGRVYIEALATGTPIVTSGYGSIGEIVGEGGRLTDGSIGEFRKTILDIVDSGCLPEMSIAAKNQVYHFRLSHTINEIELMYKEIIETDSEI